MASKIEKLEHNEERLTIEVDAATFKKAMQEVYQKQRNRFSLPGFRKGKAPFAMVVNYYGEGVFYEDAIDIVLDPAYQAALEEHEAKPFSTPDVDITEISMDKGVTFTAEYALKPLVKLGDYIGVEAYRPEVTLEDDEIMQRIDQKRFELSRLVPVEGRSIEEDDHVLLDYEGSLDGVPFAGGKAENYTLEIGSGSFIPGFEEQLIGHQAGEEFDITVTFPEEYHSEDLQGKEAVFHIKVHEIKAREIPELDDEFIKDISEDCDTVDEYKKQLREEMEAERNKAADREFDENILNILIQNSEFEISEKIVRDEMRRQFDQHRQMMMYNGFPMERYLQAVGMTEQQYMLQLREPALDSIKKSFALEAVAEKEQLEVSEEDIQKELQRMADMYKMEIEKLEEQFSADRKEDLKDQLKIGKAADFLREKAKATDVLPEEEEAEEEAETEAVTEAEAEDSAEKD